VEVSAQRFDHRRGRGPDRAATSSDFDEFFALHYARTVRLAHLLTGLDAVAEDLAQDAFARIHPHFERLTNATAYLNVTTVNVCRGWHKRRFRHEAVMTQLAEPAVTADDHHHLLALVDGLPYRQRAVLVLRYWLDLPEREIAAALGCRPATVRTIHFRALRALRKELP